jgi:hypothetical protein
MLAYNAANTLAESLESLSLQTFRDFENSFVATGDAFGVQPACIYRNLK